MIRSTNDTTARNVLYDLGNVSDRLQQLQRTLSSGKRIQAAEDDPFGAGRALFLRSEVADVQQLQRNIGEASSWTSTTDLAIGDATNVLQRVRELVVQAGNGTQDQGGLDAIRSEIVQLKETLRGHANATFAGRSIFAGSKTDTEPYPAGSNTYGGDALQVQRAIGPGQTVALNKTGPQVFGPDASNPTGPNVFDLLDTISADLAAGNRDALGGADLTQLDGALDRVTSARADVGALQNRLDTQLTHLKSQETNVQALLSNTEDADMAQTMVQFAQAQSTYQAALSAGAKIIQPTLLDFLR
jgi:flagellar hook-associated protein 3 FlgL